MEIIKTQILIIGGGAAGLNAALNLKSNDITLIEKNGSNSVLCPWNLMIKSKKDLLKEILETGCNSTDSELLDIFSKNYENIVEDLKKTGIKFRKSNLGLIPNYTQPGKEVRKIFLNKLKEKQVKLLKGSVEKLLIDKNKKIIGVKISLFNSKKIKIFFNYLVLAAGGLGGFFKFRTGSGDSDGSILALCYEAGLKIRDLEFMMFHPFLLVDKRLPRVLVSGDLLTKMEYENEKGEKFLSNDIADALKTNKHHRVFPKMTKEFYLQSLKSRIFGRLICSNKWFEKFKKENEFGFIFKNFKKNDLKKIELHPAFHFSIGGLVINKNSQTSQKNIYAAGEITGGLHGHNRIGGLAILEALIFGKKTAMEINKKIMKEKEIIIPEKIEGLGMLGLSDEIKNKAWEVLGPVKNKEDLNKMKSFLKNKKNATSQEKLLEKIIEICLLRNESIGAFYRQDLRKKETARSSFLIDKKIIFKYGK